MKVLLNASENPTQSREIWVGVGDVVQAKPIFEVACFELTPNKAYIIEDVVFGGFLVIKSDKGTERVYTVDFFTKF